MNLDKKQNIETKDIHLELSEFSFLNSAIRTFVNNEKVREQLPESHLNRLIQINGKLAELLISKEERKHLCLNDLEVLSLFIFCKTLFDITPNSDMDIIMPLVRVMTLIEAIYKNED